MLKIYPYLRRCALSVMSFALALPVFSATFTVTNTNASGPGSLAQAIADANGNPGNDLIVFNLPTDQPCIINLTAPLPTILDGLTIDGYTQPGAVAGPIATRVIRVNVNAAGAGGNAFTVDANDVTIAGLAIYGAAGYGVASNPSFVGVNNLHLWGNYIGTDSTGTTAGLGNAGGGVVVNLTSSFIPSNNIIVGIKDDGLNDANEGNLIVSSVSTGIHDGDAVIFWRCTNSVIAGNILGLDKNGANTGLGNNRDGIVVTVSSTNCVIGTNSNGTSDNLERNLIAANGRNGIQLAGISTNNIIAGNTVGLDISNAAAGNGQYGIQLLNASSNQVGTDGNGVNDAAEANIISSNAHAGLRISSETFFDPMWESGADGNSVQGNIIGTDASLTLVRPNGGVGTGNGIELQSSLAGFTVNNNFIGTDHDGVNDATERNIIVNNTGNGIAVLTPTGAGSTGNKFSGNLLYNNALLGIDLQGGTEVSGVTVNDDGDADAGANDLLNAPVITNVLVDGGDLLIEGFSVAGSVVEFYIPDAGPHPNPMPGTKSFGQGQTYLARAQEGGTLGSIADNDATTGSYDAAIEGIGAGGTRTESKFSFRFPVASLPVSVTSGTRITALAYLNASGPGSTSEFGGVSTTANLPVLFISFHGRMSAGKAHLNWETAEEQNNSHFEVQRSTAGGQYTTIGKVLPKTGIRNQYSFTDNDPAPGINYYRLKQVDLDGRFMFSKILQLRADLGGFTVKAGPNPFLGSLNIYYQLVQDELLQVRLYDPGGRVVKQAAVRGGAGANSYNLTGLHGLPKGNYTLEITGATVSHRVQVVKL